MQIFFNDSIKVARALPYPKLWWYAKAGLLRNLQKVQNYYKTANFAVRSNHLLVRILNSLGVHHGYDLERFYELVNAKTNKYSIHFKLTSPVYSGLLHDGIFYGPGVKEIIIADDTYINPELIAKDWRNFPSIRVLDHPRSDLDMLPLNGKETGIEEGTATIVINIAAMAVQFRQFCIEQAQLFEEGISPETVAMFVHSYVLPNIMPSHLDCALFNRLVNMCIGKPQGASTKKHPFFILDYSKYVDSVFSVLIENMKNTRYEFWTMLRSIPLVTAPDAQTFMKLPEITPTRQYKWAEFVTRLKCIEVLIFMSSDEGKRASAKELNYLMNAIIKYNSDGIFRQVLSGSALYDITSRERDILQAAGSNYKLR